MGVEIGTVQYLQKLEARWLSVVEHKVVGNRMRHATIVPSQR